MPRSHGRTGRPWLRLCTQVYAEETYCWLCHKPVSHDLPSTHPYSHSVDHLIQLMHGGPPRDRGNVRLAHRRCNTIRGNQLRHLPIKQCACQHGAPCRKPDRGSNSRVSLTVSVIDI